MQRAIHMAVLGQALAQRTAAMRTLALESVTDAIHEEHGKFTLSHAHGQAAVGGNLADSGDRDILAHGAEGRGQFKSQSSDFRMQISHFKFQISNSRFQIGGAGALPPSDDGGFFFFQGMSGNFSGSFMGGGLGLAMAKSE